MKLRILKESFRCGKRGWREELQPNSHKTENFDRIERWKEIGERKGEKEIKIDQ